MIYSGNCMKTFMIYEKNLDPLFKTVPTKFISISINEFKEKQSN